jgi:hypothetical protein
MPKSTDARDGWEKVDVTALLQGAPADFTIDPDTLIEPADPIEEPVTVFGNPDDEGPVGRPTVVAVCTNAECPERQMVQVYDDTPLPLHCGRCFGVMVDDPEASAAYALQLLAAAGIPSGVDLDKLADLVAGRIKKGKK